MKVSASAFVRFFSFLAILFLGIYGATGQENRASIRGTITDPSGAVIAGVEVTARNADTNVETTAVSNEDGIYLVPNLPPGTYAVTFRKTGFKEIVQPSVTLISTQVAGINVTMQIGAATENITVTAEAPVLDSESTAIGTNMSNKAITDLPLDIYGAGGRFVEDFAVALTPGYSPYSSPYGAVVNGNQWFTKDYTVDGTSGTASIRGDSMLTGPAMEAVEELQAQTSGLDSASAITNGGVMSFTLKSGTNQFHGSAFGYGHNEFLDANTFTNNLTGAPRAKARAWDYGASLGGPIFKDKLFFFGTFERYTKNDYTLSPGGFVPTTAMLNGNFSALLGADLCSDSSGGIGACGQSNGSGGTYSTTINVQNKAGQTVPLQAGMIFDPSTCNSSGANCKQFTGNIIDTPISSVAQKINAIYQKYYAPQGSSLFSNNLTTSNGAPYEINNQPVVKLDYVLTPNDRLSGSWIYINHPRYLLQGGIWEAGSTTGGPLSDMSNENVLSDQYRISESHTFSPTKLNIFNFTYNWYRQADQTTAPGNWNSQLGFGNTGSDNFPTISFGNSVNGYGVTYIGNSSQGSFAGANVITGDTFTWTKGRHTMSFGGDFYAYQVNSHKGSGALSFNFVPNTTDGGYTGVAGFGFASYLLGDVATASETTPFDLYGRRKATALFAQDSYKITPKLTLSAGLRWQYSWRYHEKYGHWANYDMTQIDPTYGYPGKLVFANGGGDSFEKKEYWDGFGPSIGFAYNPAPKWVFRGSFGLTLTPPIEPYFNGVPNGFAPGFQGTNSVNSPFDWDNGYPGVFQPGNKNVSPGSLPYPGLTFVDPHALMPGFTDAINIGLQYELTKGTRIEVAYVGSRGHHLSDTALAWDEPTSAQFLNIINANPGLVPYGDYSSWQYCATKGSPLSNQYTGVPYVGITCPYNNFYGPALAAIAPSPQLQAWSVFNYYYFLNYVGLPIGQSSYNSMVVDLVKRGGRNLTMDLNYTYSVTRGDTFSAQQEYNNEYTGVQDFQNLSATANSLTGYDLTHIIKGYVTYLLPFGRGQKWGSGTSGLVNALISGWQINGLVGYNTGQPLRVGVNTPFYPSWGNFFPNFHPSGVYGPFNPSGYNALEAQTNPNYVFNYMSASVASSPISGNTVAFGQGGAYDGSLRCPGAERESASLVKYFSMGADGRYQLSLRVEFYDLFNRHFYNINGCAGTSTAVGPVGTYEQNFAIVTGVTSDHRTGQFGVRFTF